MVKLFWFLFCVCTASAVTSKNFSDQQNCSITLPTDVQGYAPVILVKKPNENVFQLFKPEGNVTLFPSGTQLKLACTSRPRESKTNKKPKDKKSKKEKKKKKKNEEKKKKKEKKENKKKKKSTPRAAKVKPSEKNYFKFNDTKTVEIVNCTEGNFTDSEGRTFNLSAAKCKSLPGSVLNKTTTNCSQTGFIFQSGFLIEHLFHGSVFDICFDNQTERILYTHNILNGAAMPYKINLPNRTVFHADGLNYSANYMKQLYEKKHQLKHFKKLFYKYVTEKNFLARGHLSPDADFIMGYEQLATYFYLNVAPEFQSINAGNWLIVENMARKLSEEHKANIDSYNGIFDTLELVFRKNGTEVELYLDNNKTFPVPKFFAKLLLHKENKSAVVFITSNNPYYNTTQEDICPNICNQTGMNHTSFSNVTKGYTICCSLKKFNELKKLNFDLQDNFNNFTLLKGENLLKDYSKNSNKGQNNQKGSKKKATKKPKVTKPKKKKDNKKKSTKKKKKTSK